jgi:hypothetical protein
MHFQCPQTKQDYGGVLSEVNPLVPDGEKRMVGSVIQSIGLESNRRAERVTGPLL